jgi:tetratricopeptide (TPR) repeat protein
MAVRNPTSRWLVAVALAVAWGHVAAAKPPDLPATDPITCTPDQPAPVPMATVPPAPGKALEGRPVQMVFPEVFTYDEEVDLAGSIVFPDWLSDLPRSRRTFTRCLLFGVNPTLAWLPAENLLGDEDGELMLLPINETWQSLVRRVRDALRPMTPKSPNQGTCLPQSGSVVVFLSAPWVPVTPAPEITRAVKAEPTLLVDPKMPPGYVGPYTCQVPRWGYVWCGTDRPEPETERQDNLDVNRRREVAEAALRRAEEFHGQGQIEHALACYEAVRVTSPDDRTKELADRRVQQIAAEAAAVACADDPTGPAHVCPAGQPQEKPQDEGFTCPYLKAKAAAGTLPAPPDALGEGESVLDNLAKLEEAEDTYRQAEYLRRHGHAAEACAAYEKVRELAPGSRYDEMAARELEAVRAETKKPAADAGEEQEPQPKPKTHGRKGKPRTPKTASDRTSRKVSLLLELCQQFYKEGKYQEAEIVARAACQLAPDSVDAHAAVLLLRYHRMTMDGSFLEKKAGQEEKDKTIEDRLKSKVNLNFTDEPLDAVLDDLRSWTGINIVPATAALEEEGRSLKRPVTLKVEGISLQSALSLLLHNLDLDYVIRDEVLQIIPMGWTGDRHFMRVYEVKDLVDADSPEALCSQYDCKTADEALVLLIQDTIDPGSWARRGGTGTIEYLAPSRCLIVSQTEDVQEQVEQLLRSLRDLTFKQQAVKVERPVEEPEARPRPAKAVKMTDREAEIEHRLRMPVNLTVTDQPLQAVLEDLRGWYDLNLVPDYSALEAEGISLKQRVTLKVKDVSLKAALETLLHERHLTFVVKNEVVLITTEQAARGKLVTHAFPVDDLIESSPLQDAPAEERLMRLVTDTVAPKTWSQMGGQGTVEYFPKTRSLVVNQTPDVLEQVEALLAALRDLTVKESAMDVRQQPEWAGEEQEAVGPSRKPTHAEVQVGRLLESCQAAFARGDVARAESLMRQALAIDARAVTAHPIVAKTSLFSQLRAAVKAARSPRAMRQPELPPVDPTVVDALDSVLQKAEQLRERGRHAAVQSPAGGEEASEPAAPGGQELQLILEVPDAPLTFTTESEPAVAPVLTGQASRTLYPSLLDGLFNTLRPTVCMEIDPKQNAAGGRVHLQCGRLVFRADWDGTGHGTVSWGLILVGDTADTPGD